MSENSAKSEKLVVVFDYDDTLTADTERKKQGIFVEIFRDLGVDLTVVEDFVLSHPGMPRKEMVAGSLEVLAKAGYIQDPQAHQEQYLQRFAQFAEDMAVAAPLRPGALEALQALQQWPVYLLSGNPQEALERIVARREWNHLFRGIYGTSTGSKIEHLATILRVEGVSPERLVVVGDGTSDLRAAEAHGCRFIGVRGVLTSFPPDVAFPILENLSSLPSVVADVVGD